MQQQERTTCSPSLPLFFSLSTKSALLLLCLGAAAIYGGQAKPLAVHNEYPSIDLRLLDWPIANKEVEEGDAYTQLECYTELTDSFIDPAALYRVNNSGQLTDRVCMLRIPSRSRLTINRMHVHSKKSYVTVIAGSSQVFMPLRTEHIHGDEPERYGPWHVPCHQAYMVFRSKSQRLEWVEFQLTAETEEDREQADNHLCTSQGVNHAELEYANERNRHANADRHANANGEEAGRDASLRN